MLWDGVMLPSGRIKCCRMTSCTLTCGVARCRIHEGGDAARRQVLPDQPLGAIPVEALGGVAYAGEVHAGWEGRSHALAVMLGR